MAAWGMEERASTLKPHSYAHVQHQNTTTYSITYMQYTHLIFSSPVGMHMESHRSKELCTVVQKLSFRLQTLKLYLIVVPHLIRGDGRK